MSAPRFLIVRFSAVGDCVMAVPAATAIRMKHPGAFLAWAVDSRCAAVLDRERLIHLVAEFPRDRWKRERWSPRTWRDQIVHYTRLRGERFDYGLDLQGHSKTALCLRLAAPRRSVSVPATDAFAGLLNPRTRAPIKGLHMVERNLAVLGELDAFPTPDEPIMPDLAVDREKLAPRLPSGRFASICTGGGSDDKLYPAELWADVARAVLEGGLPVVWIGGAGDPAPEVEGSRSLVGALGWRESMAVVASSAVHVSGDTGTGHVAAAYGVPCATVFGPMDPALYRPYTRHGRVHRAPDGDPSKVDPRELAASALELVNTGARTVSP